jgi:hypothetical protein
MNNTRSTQGDDKVSLTQTPALKTEPQHYPHPGVAFINKPDATATSATEPFFDELFDVQQEARTMATEVIRHLLIWMADGKTLHERGLRASVALYCIRPDLVNGATLDQIGAQAGCTRQAVHKLACAFRGVTGMPS